jgi:hypothetical protein
MRPRLPLQLHRSAILLLLVFAGCAYAAGSGGRLNLQKNEQIFSNVQELRQLNFDSEVPMVLMDRDQANLLLEREVAHRYRGAGIRRAAEVGEMTGLYAAGTDLRASTMRMLSGRASGFYDPQDREMILVKRTSEHSLWSMIAAFFTSRNSIDETQVAYELTHALQDQHFDVHRAIDRITDNSDRALALKSVVEGDAALVGYCYRFGRVDADTVRSALGHIQDMPGMFGGQLSDTPAALRDSLIFQYTEGTRFVAETYRRGGWSAVNALYLNPPLSTREIVEPSLYFGRTSRPLGISVRGWSPALDGWRKVAENTYGELLLRVILTRNAGGPAGAALARGWRGDRMVVLERNGAVTVIWIVAMSDYGSAAGFAHTYEGILERLANGGAPAAHYVERRGTAVLAILGPGAAQAAVLAPALWRASVIGAAIPTPVESSPPAS